MIYLENLRRLCIQTNKKALDYRDGKAWDNRKRKTRKQCCPRGKAFRRFEDMERKAAWDRLVEGLKANSFRED